MYQPTDTSGVLLLSDPGVYILSFVIEHIDTNQLQKKYFLGPDDYSDTLRILNIIACWEPIGRPNFNGYCCCGEYCEGKQIDYYESGLKRIEGQFRNGVPVGELVFFLPSGKVREIHKYNKRGKLVRIVAGPG